MAFSFHNVFGFIICLLLTVVCSCNIASSETNAIKASDLVNEICKKTRNPTVCFQTLGSNDHNNVSLRDLGLKSVESAQLSGVLASDAVHVLSKFEKNPVLIERYRSCSGSFGRANDDVEQSSLLLKSGSYQNLVSQASDALTQADACDKNFVQPPTEPAQLIKASNYFQDVCSILLVISKQLAGDKQ